MDRQQFSYELWTNEELIQAATVERQDYLPEAMIMIEAELVRRHVSSEDSVRIEQEILSGRNLLTQKLTGVDGWLLVFVLIVIGNSIAAILGAVAGVLYNPIVGVALLPLLVYGAYGLYVFVLLIQWKVNAPRHASRWLIAGFLLGLLYIAVAYLTSGKFILSPLYGAPFLIWLQYLNSSKRVAATYSKPPETVEQPPTADGFSTAAKPERSIQQ
jgi:hypothetical protein